MDILVVWIFHDSREHALVLQIALIESQLIFEFGNAQ